MCPFSDSSRKSLAPTHVRRKTTEVTNGNTYEVYTASSRLDAIEFLKEIEVKQERRYVIVETQEGNFGKDVVMIFDEATSAKIAFGVREPLPTPSKSKTHCTRCGYPVLPAGRWPKDVNVKELILLEEMKDKGVGFYCSACEASWCPFCVPPDSADVCPLCGAHMDLYRDVDISRT